MDDLVHSFLQHNGLIRPFKMLYFPLTCLSASLIGVVLQNSKYGPGWQVVLSGERNALNFKTRWFQRPLIDLLDPFNNTLTATEAELQNIFKPQRLITNHLVHREYIHICLCLVDMVCE